MKALMLVLVLAGCARVPCAPPSAPHCAPLPPMAASQTLQDYTLDVVERYHACQQGG